MSPQLKSHQKDWVESQVKDGWDQSCEVNSVLLGKRGVPALPAKDEVIRRAQAVLLPEQVGFMQEGDDGKRPSFSYQTKLVSPSARLDLVHTLLDEQPETMSMEGREQKKLIVWAGVRKHLTEQPSRVLAPTWYWEFGQGGQVIAAPQQGDLPSLILTERKREFLRNLPRGMRGTDRFTWATRMAASLRVGKPLGASFPNDVTDLRKSEVWNYTPLDEEGEFTLYIGSLEQRSQPGACFYPNGRGPILRSYKALKELDRIRFRAAVDGSC